MSRGFSNSYKKAENTKRYKKENTLNETQDKFPPVALNCCLVSTNGGGLALKDKQL